MQATTPWQDLQHPGDATDFFLRRSFPAFDPTTSAYSGFAEALDSIWHGIEAARSKLNCPVFYTGHSLGAALAAPVAARHARSCPDQLRGQDMNPLSCWGMFPAAERLSVAGANFNATASRVCKAHAKQISV